jgi:hypothetical protein
MHLSNFCSKQALSHEEAAVHSGPSSLKWLVSLAFEHLPYRILSQSCDTADAAWSLSCSRLVIMARLLAVGAAADDTSAADRFGGQLVAGGLWLLGCLAAAAAAAGRGADRYCSPRYPPVA